MGIIPKWAVIEREVPLLLEGKKELALILFHPDFATPEKVNEVINRSMGGFYSRCVDSATIKLAVPDSYLDRVSEWIASLERYEVTPDSVAKVVLNEKTGTDVLGENVRISTVALAYGNLSIRIKERTAYPSPSPEGARQTPPIAIPQRDGTGPILTSGGLR